MTVAKNICANKRLNMFTSFIDFRKAFDVVDCKLLAYSLAINGIRGRMLCALEQIHAETWNILRLNNVFTDAFRSHNGISQGSTISPVLFCEFINGLLREIKGSQLGIR